MSRELCSYYELRNTVNEWSLAVSARRLTYEGIMKEMPNHSDWYDSSGTGRVYRISVCVDDNGVVEVNETEVFRK